MSKHHGGYVVVIEIAVGLAAKQAIAQPATRRNGHRSELRAPGDVADGVDASAAGDLKLVRHDETVLIEINARELEAESIGFAGELSAIADDDTRS